MSRMAWAWRSNVHSTILAPAGREIVVFMPQLYRQAWTGKARRRQAKDADYFRGN